MIWILYHKLHKHISTYICIIGKSLATIFTYEILFPIWMDSKWRFLSVSFEKVLEINSHFMFEVFSKEWFFSWCTIKPSFFAKDFSQSNLQLLGCGSSQNDFLNAFGSWVDCQKQNIYCRFHICDFVCPDGQFQHLSHFD